MRRLRARPQTARQPDGSWVAVLTGWNLTARGATEQEAIQELRQVADENKRRDFEAWKRRLEELFDNPPPDWEVIEDDGEAYGERLQQLQREIDEDRQRIECKSEGRLRASLGLS